MNRISLNWRLLKTAFSSVMGLLAFVSWLGPLRAQEAVQNDYGRVQFTQREEVDAWLKGEVKKSGGDWDHQRYRFILGFSTGHFGQDPMNAIAMRKVAFSLLNNSFAAGDKVLPVAWELNVWNHGKPITLSEDPQTRAAFVSAVPYSPRQGSVGGHDVERALYDVLKTDVPVGEASCTIVMLFTNSNQSMGAPGQPAHLFGQNNPQLVKSLSDAGYRTPPVRASFSLLSDGKPEQVEVSALFPAHLASLAGAPATARYPGFARGTWQPKEDAPSAAEKLPNPDKSTPSAPRAPSDATLAAKSSTDRGSLTWLWVLLGVLATAAIAFFMLRARHPVPISSKAPVEKAVPIAGNPLPGSLRVTLGYGNEQTLNSLRTSHQWRLFKEGAVATLQMEPDKPLPDAPAPLAFLGFDERALTLRAEADTQFEIKNATSLKACGPRNVRLLPGESLVCSLQSSQLTEPVRLAVVYKKEG